MMVPYRSYGLYGLTIASPIALPCPERAATDPDVVFAERPGLLFSRARREAGLGPDASRWFEYARLSKGASYLRWSELYEFVVSGDGCSIAWRSLNGGNPEPFQSYLLSQVLSFALVRQGIEPLHATSVVIKGEAVAFLGDCGYGKSSLGAAFLQAGYPLLTDDLLVLKELGDRFMAYLGAQRIKLFPEIARTVLGERVSGTPMNNQTAKLLIPLGQNETASSQNAFPLKAIYVLTAPPAGSRSHRITIRPLSARRAFVELVKNTFNTVIDEPGRLKRQFVLATRLAARVPLKSLSYPRTLAQLPAVREAVRSDLNE